MRQKIKLVAKEILVIFSSNLQVSSLIANMLTVGVLDLSEYFFTTMKIYKLIENYAARPGKPTSCKVYDGSRSFDYDALVQCSPGYDGGRQQKFTVEVNEVFNQDT